MRSNVTFHEAGLVTGDVIGAAVASAGLTGGLANGLPHFQPAAAIARIWGVAPDKRETLAAVLDLMSRHGLLERRPGPPPLYRSGTSSRFQDRRTVSERLAEMRSQVGQDPAYRDWLPTGHEGVVWDAQRAFIGESLEYLRTPGHRLAFNAEYEDVWHANLTNPLYDHGRMFCVRALVRPQGRYLDLASGLGYGTQRLLEWSEGAATVVAIDKSADFVRVARQVLHPPGSAVEHHVRDLNLGLPPLVPESFDGVLFIGAFHYIRDKLALLRQIHTALRPGGRLAIGQCFVHSGLRDDDANRYMFSLSEDRSFIIDRVQLHRELGEAEFTVLETQPRGSQYSLVAEKQHGPVPS